MTPKTRAMRENLPPCWGKHNEMDVVCADCIIEMSCEVMKRGGGCEA
jgi:hypothetical protein